MILFSLSVEAKEQERDLAFRASLMNALWLALGKYFIYAKQSTGLYRYKDLLWDVSNSSGMQCTE